MFAFNDSFGDLGPHFSTRNFYLSLSTEFLSPYLTAVCRPTSKTQRKIVERYKGKLNVDCALINLLLTVPETAGRLYKKPKRNTVILFLKWGNILVKFAGSGVRLS